MVRPDEGRDGKLIEYCIVKEIEKLNVVLLMKRCDQMKEEFEKLNVVLSMKRCHQLREEIEN